MERLWTPWRYTYVTGGQPGRKGVPEELATWPGEDTGCVFCNLLAATSWAKETGMPPEEADRTGHILTMRRHCFACLNAFPYSTGHLLILPYAHIASLAALPAPAADEMMALAREAETALRTVYRPDGLNMGINMGESAGAGVAGHLHLHVLPRWLGDTSFLTAVADVRILPETLDQTWRKLLPQMNDGQPAPQP